MALTNYKETFGDYNKYYNNIFCFGPGSNGDIYNTINKYIYNNEVYTDSTLSSHSIIDAVGTIIYRKNKYGEYNLLLDSDNKEIIRFITPSDLKLKSVIGGVYESKDKLYVAHQTSYSGYNKAPSNTSHSVVIHGGFNIKTTFKTSYEPLGVEFVNALYKPFIKNIDTIIDELNSVISLDRLQAQLTKKIFIKNELNYKYPIIYFLNRKVGYYDTDKNTWITSPNIHKKLRDICERF